MDFQRKANLFLKRQPREDPLEELFQRGNYKSEFHIPKESSVNDSGLTKDKADFIRQKFSAVSAAVNDDKYDKDYGKFSFRNDNLSDLFDFYNDLVPETDYSYTDPKLYQYGLEGKTTQDLVLSKLQEDAGTENDMSRAKNFAKEFIVGQREKAGAKITNFLQTRASEGIVPILHHMKETQRDYEPPDNETLSKIKIETIRRKHNQNDEKKQGEMEVKGGIFNTLKDMTAEKKYRRAEKIEGLSPGLAAYSERGVQKKRYYVAKHQAEENAKAEVAAQEAEEEKAKIANYKKTRLIKKSAGKEVEGELIEGAPLVPVVVKKGKPSKPGEPLKVSDVESGKTEFSMEELKNPHKFTAAVLGDIETKKNVVKALKAKYGGIITNYSDITVKSTMGEIAKIVAGAEKISLSGLLRSPTQKSVGGGGGGAAAKEKSPKSAK